MNLVEIIKLHGGDGSSDPGGDGFTGVSDKVRDREQSCCISQVRSRLELKVPEEK